MCAPSTAGPSLPQCHFAAGLQLLSSNLSQSPGSCSPVNSSRSQTHPVMHCQPSPSCVCHLASHCLVIFAGSASVHSTCRTLPSHQEVSLRFSQALVLHLPALLTHCWPERVVRQVDSQWWCLGIFVNVLTSAAHGSKRPCPCGGPDFCPLSSCLFGSPGICTVLKHF